MRKRVLFIALLAGLCIYSSAQNSENTAEQAKPAIVATDSTINQKILTELETIRGLQEEERAQRMKAVHYRDSLNKTHSGDANSSEYSVMSDVERNTRFNFLGNGWNLLALLALLVSAGSFYYALVTYHAQKRTETNTAKSEKHTQNAPLSVQKSKLQDLARHFYRNLVCTSAAIFKYKDKSNRIGPYNKPGKYPSESNILKLQVLPDDIVMPIDVAEKSYKEMHELRLLFRNYNVEVNVVSMHLSRKDISEESLVQDFDNLLYKPISLSVNTFKYERALYDDEYHGQASRNIISMIKEHFTKLIKAGNFGILLIPENNGFLRTLVKDDCAYIREKLDQKDGIGRSLVALLEEGLKDQEQLTKGILSGDNADMAMNEFISSAIVYFSQSETGSSRSHLKQKRYVASVNRNNFIDNLDCDELKEFIRDLGKLSRNTLYENEDSLSPDYFYGRYYGGKIHDKRATVDPGKVFLPLAPYLEFIAQDHWDFEAMLRYMLAVDIAIETDRIGMVNYAE